jgi:hypothetical protein
MDVMPAEDQRAKENTFMATFTIDAENNIAGHEQAFSGDNLQSFTSEKGLAKLSAEWPVARLTAIWNSFAGVAPFGELKPVRRFTDRKVAVARIWSAVQRLLLNGTEPAAALKGMAKKFPAKRTRAKRSEERSNKKADVIAMMKRARGVTLAEIVAATGWQAHTVRGFVSILRSKGGAKVESSKNQQGERTYRIAV